MRVLLNYKSFKKNKESKKQLFGIYLPVKLATGKMSIKKKKIFLAPNSSYYQFQKMAGKTEFRFRKFRLSKKSATI